MGLVSHVPVARGRGPWGSECCFGIHLHLIGFNLINYAKNNVRKTKTNKKKLLSSWGLKREKIFRILTSNYKKPSFHIQRQKMTLIHPPSIWWYFRVYLLKVKLKRSQKWGSSDLISEGEETSYLVCHFSAKNVARPISACQNTVKGSGKTRDTGAGSVSEGRIFSRWWADTAFF